MHGSRSQDDEQLAANAKLVHDLTREAIVGAFQFRRTLKLNAGDGGIENIDGLYQVLASPHKELFMQLHGEIKAAAKSQ